MKVFISHHPADHDLVASVSAALRQAGLEVCWDGTQAFPGDNIGEVVGKALDEADAMVVFASAAHPSWMLDFEVSYALGRPKFKGRIVTAVASSVPELAARIPWILRKFRWIDLSKTGREQGILDIASALRSAA